MSATALAVRLVIGLVVTFGCMALLAKLATSRRSPFRGARRAASIETTARLALNKSASVALLRVGEREVLVGVTPQRVSVLAESRAGELSGRANVLTLDASDTGTPKPEAPAALTRSALPLSATALDGTPAAAVTGVRRPWWPTFVELLRERTTRRRPVHGG